jgi:hypothetical protein
MSTVLQVLTPEGHSGKIPSSAGDYYSRATRGTGTRAETVKQLIQQAPQVTAAIRRCAEPFMRSFG